FNHPPTTEIYTLSLHDALPISFLAIAYVACCDLRLRKRAFADFLIIAATDVAIWALVLGYFFARGSGAAFVESVFSYNRYYSSRDRKSTRLNSSHSQISYAVFC